MAIEVKFTRGTSSFSLSNSVFAVGTDFAPPGINAAYNVSAGTSANQTGGGTLIGSRVNNRPWAFTLRILASNINQAHSYARKLVGFIKAQSGEPLYIDYRENADIPVPLWGQFGAPLRFEVVTCDVSGISDAYLRANGKGFFVTVVMEIKPLAVGLKQSLVNAKGVVIEDTLGRVDGSSGGLIVSPIGHSVVNFFTNPVHGNATYSTGWTAGSDVIQAKNIDPDFVLFGSTSARLTLKSSATDTSYTSLVTAGSTGSHRISAYFRKQDGSAVTSADVRLLYNGTLATTSFDAEGNGWYRAYATVTGVAAATAAGCSLLTIGVTLYVTGFQFEREYFSRPVPFMFGDMLGCAWSGTAHASTTTATAGIAYARAADLFSIAQGTICIVWEAENTSTAKTSALWMFQDDVVGFRGGWNGATGAWFLNDGVNGLTTAADSFAKGDKLVLHFVWGPAQLTVYRNGVLIGTTANYKPASLGEKFYIGTASTGASPIGGTFVGFTTYDVAFTSAQALAAYNAIDAVVTAGNQVDAVPWLWTKDGDGIVDNCNDGTRNNWAVVAGIPGSMDAHTEILGKLTNYVADLNAVTISNLRVDTFRTPVSRLFWDESGTVDAAYCGGAYQLTSVNTAAVDITAAHTLDKDAVQMLRDNEYIVVGRVADAGDNLVVAIVWADHANQYAAEPFPGSTPSLMISAGDILASILPIGDAEGVAKTYNFTVKAYRTIAGAANVKVDWVCLFPRPVIQVGSGASDGFTYSSAARRCDDYNSSTLLSYSNRSFTGDILEMAPGKCNILQAAIGKSFNSIDITETLAYSIFVTPRYALV
jgi:hypothetical protein